jgi:hypothetical protein
LAVIAQPVSDQYSSVALHRTLPLLAAVGNSGSGAVIHIWDLDLDTLFSTLPGRAPLAVHHATAKIVLLGDSGVGKTGLGWRLAHGYFKEHASTHGQQFWVLDQLSTRLRLHREVQCEAILRDLAGQADYRLTHALFIDDADPALLLFDPSDSRDPLHGVEFWLKHLRAGQTQQGGKARAVVQQS